MAQKTLPDAVQQFDNSPDGAVTSIATTCAVTELSRATIYRLFKSGKLTMVKVGNSTRINVGELRRLIGGAA